MGTCMRIMSIVDNRSGITSFEMDRQGKSMKEMRLQAAILNFRLRSVKGGKKSRPGLTVMGPVSPGSDRVGDLSCERCPHYPFIQLADTGFGKFVNDQDLVRHRIAGNLPMGSGLGHEIA